MERLDGLGRIQPQAIDLEKAVLGAILLELEAFSKVIDILQPRHFYEPIHEIIFSAMIRLNNDSKPIDILTLSAILKETKQLDKVGGYVYIAELSSNVSSSANIEYHARLISQFWIARNTIQVCNEAIHKCYEKEDVFNVTDKLLSDIDNAINFQDTTFPKLSGEVFKDIEQERTLNNGKGLMTGFEKLDLCTNGHKKGELIILAARPGMGKTAFVLQLCTQIAESKKSVLFFSLEMSREQLIRRVESQLSGINNRNIENKKVYQDQVEKLDEARKRIRKMSLLVDDSAAISVPKMKLKAKRVKNKYGLDFIVVDYLQLASGSQKGNREHEISEISRNLKVMAKELEVPVYALSQLSRAVESRSDKRPMLSDLRESGSIEQDADIVAFLYRDKYYSKNEDAPDICELIIAKHRNGNLETINFEFNGATTSFKDTDKTIEPIKEKVLTPFGSGKWTNVRDLSHEHQEENDTPF